MKVLVAGASGFLGSQLGEELRQRGHDVVALVRRPASAPAESTWDPYAGTYDREVIETADVVVNLAGAPTVGNPHSSRWKRDLVTSRVATTRVLAGAIAASARRPAFLAGNGISYYGDHRDVGDPVLTETSDSRGDALLTNVSREWQAAAQQARDAGARVCILRTAPVMDRRSPPLKQLRLLFKAGLGAKLGDGRQRMPMISLRDWVAATVHLAEHADASGPFNLCCPKTPTNAEFTRELAAQLRRPAFLPAPAVVVGPAAGAMAPELLGSLNVRPAALEATGYRFIDPDVRAVLRAGLS
jgi:uncharacterized protein (TIGR01777 family)